MDFLAKETAKQASEPPEPSSAWSNASSTPLQDLAELKQFMKKEGLLDEPFVFTNEQAVRENWEGDLENDTAIKTVDEFIKQAKNGGAVVDGAMVVIYETETKKE